MIETRLHQFQSDAESIYKEMTGGKEISLEIIATSEITVAGIYSAGRKLFIHPDFLLPRHEAEILFPDTQRSRFCQELREYDQIFKRVKRAILAHEIAHLLLGHRHSPWPRYVATAWMIPTGILIIPYLSAIPFFITLLVIRKLSIRLLRPLERLSVKHYEHEADLAALQTTKDMQAFEYFLLTASQYKKRFSFSHPDPLDRINYLREHYVQ